MNQALHNNMYRAVAKFSISCKAICGVVSGDLSSAILLAMTCLLNATCINQICTCSFAFTQARVPSTLVSIVVLVKLPGDM